MPDLWEMILSDDSAADVCYLPKTHIIALSLKAKKWFERHYGDYVSIREQR